MSDQLKFSCDDKSMSAIYSAVVQEMNRAIEKHPVWPESVVERAAIVGEEAGEVLREANHLREGNGSLDLLKNELIQTAGTCFRMLWLMDQKSNGIKEEITQY